jgi:VIT1/CCC1 family predicted Fe2+/Mn2+ transporter
MERELEVEREALTLSPEGEAQELRGMYEERGIAPAVARDMVHEVMQDPELALETHAREELGISPKHLGSPVQAALSSFFAFGLGAFIPLVPWLFSRGNGAILASVLLSAVAAVTIGIVLALFTRRSMFRSALRQLALTAVAAAVTYAIGRALGTGIS